MAKTAAITNEQIITAYEKYVPKNITLEQFAQMLDQDPYLLSQVENGTLGEFSTFDRNLSKALKPIKLFTSPDSKAVKNARKMLRDKMDETKETRQIRVKEIQKIYKEIICSNDEILAAAWTFDLLDDQEKQKLATDIVNALNKYFNLTEKIEVKYNGKMMYNMFSSSLTLPTKFINSVYAFLAVFFEQDNIDDFYSDASGAKCIHPQSSFKNKTNKNKTKIQMGTCYYFNQFLCLLSHEYGHFIDYQHPDKGMLGAQIQYAGDILYGVDYGKDYGNGDIMNPSEISSYAIGDSMDYMFMRGFLVEQSRKRPELYIKTVKRAVDKYKARHQALMFKYQKLHDKYVKLRDKLIAEHCSDFHSLSQEQQKVIIKKIKSNLHLKLMIFQLLRLKYKWKNFYNSRIDLYESDIKDLEKYLVLHATTNQASK